MILVLDEHGIVVHGLSHLAIPNGYSLGGKISQHGPLWCTMLEPSDFKNSSKDQEASENDNDYVPVK